MDRDILELTSRFSLLLLIHSQQLTLIYNKNGFPFLNFKKMKYIDYKIEDFLEDGQFVE
jgi:hypothetical protein